MRTKISLRLKDNYKKFKIKTINQQINIKSKWEWTSKPSPEPKKKNFFYLNQINKKLTLS